MKICRFQKKRSKYLVILFVIENSGLSHQKSEQQKVAICQDQTKNEDPLWTIEFFQIVYTKILLNFLTTVFFLKEQIQKKDSAIEYTYETGMAFENLKKNKTRLNRAQTFVLKQFFFTTDASKSGILAILIQQDKQDR